MTPPRRSRFYRALSSSLAVAAGVAACAVIPSAGVAAADIVGPGYVLSQTASGAPERWDPCKPIDYQINANMNPGSVGDIQEAVRRLSDASGLRYNFLGYTNEVPQYNYGSDWSPTNPKPLLIAWGNSQTSNTLSTIGGAGIAVGGYRASSWTDANGFHSEQIVTGQVFFDVDRMSSLTPGFSGGGVSRGEFMMHELGHTVGLQHSSPGQIMNYSSPFPETWGDGDRAGLQLVGAAAGCISTPPVGSLDNVTWQQTSASAGTLNVSGWAFDPNVNTSGQVHVYVDGNFAGAVNANGSRPDVAAAYNRSAPAGFNTNITATNAMHRVCVYAIGGNNPLLGCADRGNIAPVGALDSVTRTQTVSGATVAVSGWAFDPEGRATVNVHIYVDGQFAGLTTADGNRPDVSNVYGGSGAFGYSASLNLSPGDHNVCTYAIDSTNGPNSLIRCQVIGNRPPVGSLDGIALFRTGDGQIALQVAGWAADPDTTNSTQVHVYLDGQGFAIADANGSRPDVAAFLGRSQDAYGFDTARTVSGGSHTVCAYAIDTEGGQNTTLGCTHFTV